ncbi:MAG: hypothetical protein ACTSPB_15645 [Candidatus Thorarchaeota archaeon]
MTKYDTTTITIKKDTWKWLHKLRIEHDFKNLNETLYCALAVLDMVTTLAKKYGHSDYVEFTRDMIYHYDEYLRGKYKRVIQ